MKSLKIPKRDRLKGQTIMCRKCGNNYCSEKRENGTTRWVCKNTGKLLGSCPNPESQKYVSTLYNPFTQKTDIRVPHETRDFWDFRKRHNELLEVEREIRRLHRIGKVHHAMNLVKSFRKSPIQKQNENYPRETKEVVIKPETYLESAMLIYSDFLDGKIGQQWEKRPKSPKSIENYKRTLERFHECLRNNGFNPEIISLSSLAKEHLNCWVREVKERYKANKTQNDYLNNLSIFLKWCSKRGGGAICNSLDHVQRGKTKGDTHSASLYEFSEMIALITPENGKGKENWRDSKSGKIISKSKNYYRDWLVDGLWLSLLLGGRGDDITDFKWNEIHFRKTEQNKELIWIELPDHKYHKSQGVERYNFVPVYKQTYQILERLGLKDNIGKDEFVLAPEFTNRKRMKRILGESFRWFWKLAGFDPHVKYKSLRSTYITLATNLAGD